MYFCNVLKPDAIYFYLLGWVQYGNHIYRLFNETKNWESAKVNILFINIT